MLSGDIMGTMRKPLLKRKGIWELAIAVGAGLIILIVDRSIPNIKLSRILFSAFNKVLHFNIPDIVFIVSIIGILILVFRLNKKVRGLSPERFKELQADNQRMRDHINLLIEDFNNAIKRNEKIFEDYSTVKSHYPQLFDSPSDAPLVFQDDVYWKRKDGGDPEGPFCPRCYDDSRKQSHMLKVLDSNYYKCPACDLRIARPSGKVGPPILC